MVAAETGAEVLRLCVPLDCYKHSVLTPVSIADFSAAAEPHSALALSARRPKSCWQNFYGNKTTIPYYVRSLGVKMDAKIHNLPRVYARVFIT